MNLGQDVTRIWEFREDPSQMDAVRIVLKHNPVTQVIQVSVDGQELTPGTLHFALPGGLMGKIVIDAQSKSFFSRLGTFQYQCIVAKGNVGEGIKLKESNELMKELDDGISEVEVQIPQVVVDGNKTVWYFIRAKLVRIYKKCPPRVLHFAVHRRFRDFYFCYKQICMAFRGTHMLSSIPKHPARQIKFLEDHFRPEFLEARRSELESWLRRTLMVPRVGINPDVEAFLGMGDPAMREVSVVITEGSTLGLRLKKRHGQLVPGTTDRYETVYPQAIVVDYMPGPDGKRGVAEESGLVGIGDVVSKIAGESVVNACYEEIVPRLKNAPRPLLVHFLGYSFASGNFKKPNQKQQQQNTSGSETAKEKQQQEEQEQEQEQQGDVDHYYEDEEVKDVPKDPSTHTATMTNDDDEDGEEGSFMEQPSPKEEEKPKFVPMAPPKEIPIQKQMETLHVNEDEEQEVEVPPPIKEKAPEPPVKEKAPEPVRKAPEPPVIATEPAPVQQEQEPDLLGLSEEAAPSTEQNLIPLDDDDDDNILHQPVIPVNPTPPSEMHQQQDPNKDAYNDDDLLEDVSF